MAAKDAVRCVRSVSVAGSPLRLAMYSMAAFTPAIPSFQISQGDQVEWTEKGQKTALFEIAKSNCKSIQEWYN